MFTRRAGYLFRDEFNAADSLASRQRGSRQSQLGHQLRMPWFLSQIQEHNQGCGRSWTEMRLAVVNDSQPVRGGKLFRHQLKLPVYTPLCFLLSCFPAFPLSRFPFSLFLIFLISLFFSLVSVCKYRLTTSVLQQFGLLRTVES